MPGHRCGRRRENSRSYATIATTGASSDFPRLLEERAGTSRSFSSSVRSRRGASAAVGAGRGEGASCHASSSSASGTTRSSHVAASAARGRGAPGRARQPAPPSSRRSRRASCCINIPSDRGEDALLELHEAGVAGCAAAARHRRSRTQCPSGSTSTRPASVTASMTSWVMRTVVNPSAGRCGRGARASRAASARRARRRARRAAEARPADQRAVSATRCRPPKSTAGQSPARSSRLTSASARAALAPAGSRAMPTFSSTRCHGIRRASWNSIRRGRQAGERRAVQQQLAVARHLEAASSRSSVLFRPWSGRRR